MGRRQDEASQMHLAGVLFFEAETETGSFLDSIGEEFVSDATKCFLLAISLSLSERRPTHAAALYRELGWSLKQLGRIEDSIEYFRLAAQYYNSPEAPAPMLSILSLRDVADTYLLRNDYLGLQNTLDRIVVVARAMEAVGSGSHYGQQTVIDCWFALILLNLLRGHIKEAKEIINEPGIDKEDSLLGSLFDSLISVWENDDTASVSAIIDELSPHVTPLQLELLAHLENQKK
eukprot:TRINITY_DN5000_c0_g1_i2.p1 TRINITY_DN5000_c0_g1~~TRINITY_DN5000_c0_g1_i2.p1  ORF type:complete len:233 (+),score=61.88 TRINITY_DN5000_c0_g1_i2:276-974(+)